MLRGSTPKTFVAALGLVMTLCAMPAFAGGECVLEFVKSCRCPSGCTQGYCEQVCSLKYSPAPGGCMYFCGVCQCAAWAGTPVPRKFAFLGLLVGDAHSAESEVAVSSTDKVVELHNSDGDFVFVGKAEAERLANESGGIGVFLQKMEGKKTVVGSVQDGGPAGKGGLRAGDEVVSVDGKSTDGVDLKSVTEWVRGRPGTMVVLKVRGKEKTVRQVSLIRVLPGSFGKRRHSGLAVKSVPLSRFGAETCPKDDGDCRFLAREGENCMYSCKGGR